MKKTRVDEKKKNRNIMGLVLWIAIFIKSIADLLGYIDDNFSFDEEGNVMWYEPYHC